MTTHTEHAVAFPCCLMSAAFLSRFSHCCWLLLPFVLGGFFVASRSGAGDPPTAAEPSKTEIALQRSPCLGTCPNYKVTIHGDGRLVFTTDIAPAVPEFTIVPGVLSPGTHEDRIASETVAALFARFQKAGFFDLRNSYRAERYIDGPTYVLTVDSGRRHKSVEDYVGREVGMPKVVTELEDGVDEVAGTDRWVRGSAALTAWLEGQHFDFHSPEGAQLAVRGASGEADEAMVLALIDHGAPLDAEVSGYRPEAVKEVKEKFPKYTPPPAGVSLMESAIKRGQVTLFNKLAADGWLDRLGKERAA